MADGSGLLTRVPKGHVGSNPTASASFFGSQERRNVIKVISRLF